MMAEWCIKNKGGSKPPLVLLPGWGFTGAVFMDHSAFASETLITSSLFTHPEMLSGLADFLVEQGITTVRMLGWSMGGNLAVDFVLNQPELVVELTLVSVRRGWPSADVELTREGLHQDAGITRFYRTCFVGAKKEYEQYASLLASYQERFDSAVLDAGLTYLADHRLPKSLPLPVHLLYGEKDVVCPLAEQVVFTSETRVSLLAGAGHFLFSHPGFKL